MGFPKIWCLAVMPKRSFYTVWLSPSYDIAWSEIRIEAVVSSRRCAVAYTSLIVYHCPLSRSNFMDQFLGIARLIHQSLFHLTLQWKNLVNIFSTFLANTTIYCMTYLYHFKVVVNTECPMHEFSEMPFEQMPLS